LLVVDASVAVKWFLRDSSREPDTANALAILRTSCNGKISFHQPPHFITEVAAVLSRLKPREALDHHLFDTLYHAVALSIADTELITADQAYYRKARKQGNILLLGDFTAS